MFEEGAQTIKIVVAAEGGNGPDLFFVQVRVRQDQYNDGYHYDVAKDVAGMHDYGEPMVAIDEFDPPKPLFDLFDWETADVLDVSNETL